MTLLSQEGRPLTGLDLNAVDQSAKRDLAILHLTAGERSYLETHDLDSRAREIISETKKRAQQNPDWLWYRNAARMVAVWERQVEDPTRLTVAQVQRLRRYFSEYRPGFVDCGVVSYIQEKFSP